MQYPHLTEDHLNQATRAYMMHFQSFSGIGNAPEAPRVTGSGLTTAANQLQQYQKLLQIQRARQQQQQRAYQNLLQMQRAHQGVSTARLLGAELIRQQQQQQAANVVASQAGWAARPPNNIPKIFTKPELIERQRKILEDIEQQKKDEAFARQLEREFQENNEEDDEDGNDDGEISNEEIVFSGSENDEDDNEAVSDAGEIVLDGDSQTEVCHLKLYNYIYFIGVVEDTGLQNKYIFY